MGLADAAVSDSHRSRNDASATSDKRERIVRERFGKAPWTRAAQADRAAPRRSDGRMVARARLMTVSAGEASNDGPKLHEGIASRRQRTGGLGRRSAAMMRDQSSSRIMFMLEECNASSPHMTEVFAR